MVLGGSRGLDFQLFSKEKGLTWQMVFLNCYACQRFPQGRLPVLLLDMDHQDGTTWEFLLWWTLLGKHRQLATRINPKICGVSLKAWFVIFPGHQTDSSCGKPSPKITKPCRGGKKSVLTRNVQTKTSYAHLLRTKIQQLGKIGSLRKTTKKIFPTIQIRWAEE